MSFLKPTRPADHAHSSLIGVGLRHPHYREALEGTSALDFVEVHAENFFAEGGLTRVVLSELIQTYEISLHSTSLGLGSAIGINNSYLERLAVLIEEVQPILVSDHASFSWSALAGKPVHAGDLLPLEFSPQSLDVLAMNVDLVQQRLGRQILVENLSAYLQPGESSMSETEFLSGLVERAHCGLLIDLNNVLVNLHNEGVHDPVSKAKLWLQSIPASAVGELHLAGYSPVAKGELIIDDHSRQVSAECWELYTFAIQRFGPVTTLIEWDNDLPDWLTLIEQAEKARELAKSVLSTKQAVAL